MLSKFYYFFREIVTHENGESINSAREHIETKLLDKFKAEISINDKTLPDPIALKEGRVGVEAGIKLWVQLYLTDITRFYSEILNKKGIV